MKINYNKEQCIETIEAHWTSLTEGEIELYKTNLPFFEMEHEVYHKLGLDNLQFIIKCLYARNFVNNLKKLFK